MHDLTIKHNAPLEGIDLYVNAVCNLACESCFLGDHYFDGSQMALEEAQRILEWAADRQVREVAILGGEPTMHPDLAEIVNSAQRTGFKVRLISNGGPSFRSFLRRSEAALVETFYISLDGPTEDVHDSIRGRGSFRHVLASFAALQQRSARVVATVTLGRRNAEYALETVHLARSLGAERANIHWLSASGRADNGQQTLNGQEWTAVRASLENLPALSGFEVDIQLAHASRGIAELAFCAIRTNTNLQFMPSGAVLACGLTVDRPTSSSYEWTTTGLNLRAGSDEQFRSQSVPPESGCPMRQKEADIDLLPVCIYVRQVLSSATI